VIVTVLKTLTVRHLSQAAGLLIVASGAAIGQTSPTGLWNTISDRDGKPTAVIELRETRGEYTGIVRGLLVEATREDSVCGKCPGARKGKPIVGMEILSHMRRDPDHGDQWSGGEILDPETGKTYRARMTLADSGRKLVVRGYIGLPVFGRSQTWLRQH
jgi:uncharacterized protein (DUF2147 family)